MATVEEVASLALSAVVADATQSINIEQVGLWVAERYKELVSRARFRQRRKFAAITMPTPVTTGTITVATNATTVALDATAQAAVTAAGGPGAMGTQDWYIWLATLETDRAGAGIWYPVLSYLSPNLTIGNPFTGTTLTAASFILLKRFHPLQQDARWIGKFVFPRRRRALEMRAFVDFDRIAPDRILHAPGPACVAEATNVPSDTTDLGTAGAKRVELYPYSDFEETIYYTYWSLPILTAIPTALLDVTLPQEIDPYVLREGVLIDLYRYRMSQALKDKDSDGAGFWRNEMRAQMNSWDTQIQQAARADRGQDDVSFIYSIQGLSDRHSAGMGSDIRTGYDQWVAYGWQG